MMLLAHLKWINIGLIHFKKVSRKHTADSVITNLRLICLKKEYHSNYISMYNCLKPSQMTEYILTLPNMPSVLIKPPVLKINIVFSMLTITERKKLFWTVLFYFRKCFIWITRRFFLLLLIQSCVQLPFLCSSLMVV